MDGILVLTATATATVAGGTAGTASQWSFGTFVLWGVVLAVGLYVLYRRLA